MIVTKHQDPQDDQQRKNNESTRSNFCMCFIGTNRTGKSALAKKIAEEWKLGNKGKILAFDPQENFSLIADDFIQPFNDSSNWKEKILSMRNGLIIFDDYKLLHDKYIAQKWLQILMNFRAKWNVDIIFITHSPGLVITYLTYYITHYFIFFTKTLQGGFEKKIPDFDLCISASNTINDYVSAYGKGTYPNFPYVIVDTQTQKIIAQNIDLVKFKKINQNRKKNEEPNNKSSK